MNAQQTDVGTLKVKVHCILAQRSPPKTCEVGLSETVSVVAGRLIERLIGTPANRLNSFVGGALENSAWTLGVHRDGRTTKLPPEASLADCEIKAGETLVIVPRS